MTVVYLTRDMMPNKHADPTTDRAKRLEEVIIAIAERWGTPEFPAIEYLRAWERDPHYVPISTICHEFRKVEQ